MLMNELILENIHPLEWNDRISFECSGCGACCRHVKESVPLESLDAFRLAGYLKQQGHPVTCMDDVLCRYAVPVPINECGYFLYMLGTTGPDDACIFLKDNRCTIHDAKPRACRTYPLSAEPTAPGFRYHLCTEKPHHFHGKAFKARDFMKRYFTQEDRAFVSLDFQATVPIANLLRRIQGERKKTALILFLRYKYSDFDLNKPFMEQYERNTEKLLSALETLTEKR